MNVLVDLRGATIESVPRLVQKFERFGRIVDCRFKTNECFYKATIGCIRFIDDRDAEIAGYNRMNSMIFEKSVVLVRQF